ncbi:MAG: hypothetical protein HUJ68_08465 [Clostridia bacterium]|nr:hypothetical protein [Clostridia bacterium]
METENKDYYNNPIVEYSFVEEITVDFQPASNKELEMEFGEVLENAYKLYAEIDADIQPTDKIVYNGEYYSIIGDSLSYSKFLKHQELFLQKERKEQPITTKQ